MDTNGDKTNGPEETEDPEIYRAGLLPISDDAQVTRRNFLKGTVAAAGSAYLLTMLTGCETGDTVTTNQPTGPTTQSGDTIPQPRKSTGAGGAAAGTTESSTTTTNGATTTEEPTTTTEWSTDTTGSGGAAGGLCSCDTVCTCEAVCTCESESGSHYWYPC
jgi:hypothetical protein